MDGPLLHTRLRNRSPQLVPSNRRFNPHPHQPRLCPGWFVSRLAAHQAPRELLVVCSLPSPSLLVNLLTAILQTDNHCLLPLLLHHPSSLPNLQPLHPRTPLPPRRLHERPLHRRSTKLHARPPATPHAALHALYLHLAAHHLPRLRGLVRLRHRRRPVRARPQTCPGGRLRSARRPGGREDLVRKLIGSPALVKSLEGVERIVAVQSYVGSLRQLFLTGAGLALMMVLVQAGTGWKAGVVRENESASVGNGRGAGDEEWEEGMEQGV